MAGATATRTADAGEASEKADAKPQRRWLEQLPVLAVVAALGVVALNAVTGAQSPDAVTRERIFDAYQRFDRPAPAPLDAFHVVEIDRESLDAVGPWPWPRTELARLVDAATADGARAVLIAEPIDAPDPLSADVIGRFWLRGGPDARLGDALATLPDTDAALADTLAGVRSAVAIAGPAHTATGALLRTADAAPRSGAWLKTEGSVTAPAAAPRAAPPVAITEVATVSVAALPADGDGIVRRVPVFWSVDGALTPALALEATRLAADRSPSALVAASANDNEGGRGRIETVVFESGGALPLSAGAARIATPGDRPVATTSAARLLSGDAPVGAVRDRVVLIGLDASEGGAVELASGPVSHPQAQARIAARLLGGGVLARPAWTGYLEALAAMLLGAAAIMWAQRAAFWNALWLAGCFSALVVAGSYAAYALGGLLVDPAPGVFALFLGAFSVAGGRSLGAALTDDEARGGLQDALPADALTALRDGEGSQVLDGQRREITVLSCALELSREAQTRLDTRADDVVEALAHAVDALRAEIVAAGGAADLAGGARVDGYFGAPLERADHAQAAAAAALRLVEAMDRINAAVSGQLDGAAFRLSVGAAAGTCYVGPLRRGRRWRYAGLGAAADLAAFLRARTSAYGPAILCDDAVFRESNHRFAYLELDRTPPDANGARRPFYALVGNPFVKSSKRFRALDEAHRDMLTAYRERDAERASAALQRVRRSPGATIAVYDLYGERIAALRKSANAERA